MTSKILIASLAAALSLATFAAPAFAHHKHTTINANGGNGGFCFLTPGSCNGGDGGTINFNGNKPPKGSTINANGGNGGVAIGGGSANGGNGGTINF